MSGNKLATSNGFTLIELLVVVSIVAMISLAVYSSFSAGAGIWMRINKGASGGRLLLAWEEMQKDIRKAFSFKAIGFEGTGNSFSFPGIVSVKGNDGTMHDEVGRVRYYYDDKGKCLCLEKIAYVDLMKNVQKECQKESSGIKKITFGYYGSSTGANQNQSWLPSWKGDKKPAALRFNVVTVSNNEKQFTTLLP